MSLFDRIFLEAETPEEPESGIKRIKRARRGIPAINPPGGILPKPESTPEEAEAEERAGRKILSRIPPTPFAKRPPVIRNLPIR